MPDDDYRYTIFSQGIVCRNTNNDSYCIVIDGHQGNDNDRASLVMEFCGKGKFIVHTPPNRALKPTGQICRFNALKKALDAYVGDL